MKILVVLVLLLLIAAISDFYRGKVPNAVVVTGCFYGTFCLVYDSNFIKCIPGILFPIVILYPLYKIGVIGAGDIKLFFMTGFYFPFMKQILCIFTAFILGAIISVISFIRYDNFPERMTYLFSYLKECFNVKEFRYYYLDSEGKRISGSMESKSKIHFAIPIFISVLFHMGGVSL